MADIVILPELWLAPDEHLKGRYPDLMDWIRYCYDQGAAIYSACSGSIMLAETGLLDGKRVVITAGPTHEPLDPVRYLGNRSSGKMGYSLARAAVDAGALTTLVSGPVNLDVPERSGFFLQSMGHLPTP